jgi:ParB family transcriptional regulator, chromosome partitioning protein
MSVIEQSAPQSKPKVRLKNLPLSQIKEPKDALRKVNKKRQEYIEMVSSVRDKGILNAILVREVKDDTDTPYSIVEGLHRYSAAQDAGLIEIPAQIQTMTDAEVYEAQIIGNMKKIETRPAEYAAALSRIFMSNPTMTKKELASKLSCSTTKIDNILKIND